MPSTCERISMDLARRDNARIAELVKRYRKVGIAEDGRPKCFNCLARDVPLGMHLLCDKCKDVWYAKSPHRCPQ